jgi:Ran GTPase-activating protein (RanGAP) involved in mRNA processing and transport
MRNLEEINLSECFQDPRGTEVRTFIDSLLACKQLSQLDLSKNAFSRDNINHIFKSIAARGKQLECLAVSQVNLHRETLQNLVSVVETLPSLRKLNISGNEKVSEVTVQQILKTLVKHGCIEDLDLSKTGINNDLKSMVLLAELIQTNKKLRSLGLQRIGLNEGSAYPLVDALSSSLNVETLSFDFNNLGSIFVRNLVDRLISNKRLDNVKAS